MDEDGRLRNVTSKAQAIAKARKPQALAKAINEYIAEHVEQKHEENQDIAKAWRETVPSQLASFCRLAEITRGRVRIVVQSPSHLYQLRLSERELLLAMQKRCGRKAVKELKFEIGR
jgi:predicted nucleic acid-binding Zn ribbon protein